MELTDIAKQVIELARKAGADEAEVVVRSGSEFTAKVRLGKVEVLKEARSHALGLRVFCQKHAAITYTSDLSEAGLAAFARNAVELARLGEPDEFYTLPDGPFADPARLPALDLYDPAVLSLSTEERLAQAREAEEAALAADPRITNSDGATCESGEGAVAFANSAGFLGSYASTHQSLVVEAIADDTEGKKRNGYDWSVAHHREDLRSPKEIGQKAAEKTVKKLGARKIPTQEAKVVFDPEAGRALLQLLFSVVSGSAIYRRASYLLDREGTRIASDKVTILDDPLLPRGLGSRPFDGDGLPVQRNVVVQNGVLEMFLCDTYSARKLGRKSTANAGRSVSGPPGVTLSNFYLQEGEASPDDILTDTKEGLYVTQLMGFGFNPVTGDFSRGAAGFWISGGELSYPVAEITISANFDDLWQNIDLVGNDLKFRSSISCPTFRVSRMTIGGR